MFSVGKLIQGVTLTDTQQSEALLKTGKILQFRLAFALVGLLLSLVLTFVAKSEFDLRRVSVIASCVVVYTWIGFWLLSKECLVTARHVKIFNACLLGFDIVALTTLVHFTLGVESDLYVLYLLPILLSSYTFSKPGIYATSLFVSASYVVLLLIENNNSIALLTDAGHHYGLAGASLHRLWGKILARSALLVSVSFIWGGFCGYMSDLNYRVAKRLRRQLAHNERLVAEVKAQAAKERLINSINAALSSTLDLDLILFTAVKELHSALNVYACAIVTAGNLGSKPQICEFTLSTKPLGPFCLPSQESQFFGAPIAGFLLSRKSSYEKDPISAGLIKTFVIPEPERSAEFAPIKDALAGLKLKVLVIQPIIYGDESKGIILIADHGEKKRWSAAEQELVKTVAGQVAVAIENAKLVEKLSSTNEDLIQKNLNLDAKNLELRAVQGQLVHQEKMASLGRLVAGIAHELNNPINFVHGNLPYLREYCEDLKNIIAAADTAPEGQGQAIAQLKEKLKYNFLVTDLDNILADLEDGTDRIRQIIKNLRSFSRLDEAELKEASINEGIESTLKILSQYYGADKISAKTDFSILPPVLCYPGQLNQLWMNLLSNAAQAVAAVSEPSVSISTRLVEDEVLITIADNGSGIKPGVESKIFEPFFTTKPVGQGTGLGLSICHSIIERHGGKIWFEYGESSGTIFKVRIPLEAKQVEAKQVEAKQVEAKQVQANAQSPGLFDEQTSQSTGINDLSSIADLGSMSM